MNVTTLNISAGTIKVLSRQGAALKWQEAPLPPASLKNGLVLQPETLGRDIKALFQAGKLSGRVVSVVNGLPFTYRLFNVPALSGDALDEAVLRMARQEMSISPDEMYLAWQAYPGTDGEYQVLAAGITRRPVDNLMKALSAAGITPWLLDLPHFALARLCPYPDAVIVDFEKDCSNIVMMVGGIPRGMHMVPGISAEATLQDQVGQVMDKLARMIEFYNSSHPANPLKEPLKLLVTGELLEDAKALDFIHPQPGYSVEALVLKDTVSDVSANRAAVNAGMLDIRSESTKNALPRRCLDMSAVVREQRPKSDISGLFRKLAMPLAVFAAICLLTMSYLSLNKNRAELNKVQSEFTRANAAFIEKKAASTAATATENRINAMASRTKDIIVGHQDIFAPRTYVDDVASIIASLPDNVTINKLDVNAAGISLDGVGAQASLAVTFADALESTGGFSKAVINSIDKSFNFKISITR